MKKKLNITILAMAMFYINIGLAQKGELLVTASKVSNSIKINYELLNDEGVAGLQFDIILPDSQAKSLNIKSCASIYSNSPLAQCALKGNRLRVIIINQSLTEMDSGELGEILIASANGILDDDLKVTKALLFDNKGNERSIEAVIDYKNISIRDRQEFPNNRDILK